MATSSSSLALQYPYPSTLNAASFVAIKLSSSINNYSLWAANMICLLESQELVGFIDGTIPMPNGGADDDYRRWKRSDRLVKGWIFGSLHEDVLVTVVGLSTAKSVWMQLLSTLGSNSQGNNEEEVEGLQENHLKNYTYLSNINLSNYVSIKLITDNYFLWARQVFSLLRHQGLMSFIMDEAPLKYYGQRISKKYEVWEETDLLVQRWILDSIGDDVILTVTGLTTSRAIMIKLETVFVPNSIDYFISRRAPPTRNDLSYYLPLYKAALEGDWEEAKRFMDRDRSASTAFITPTGDTIIHVAVLTGKAFHFLESLVGYLGKEGISVKNSFGDTPLGCAALVGNTKAAKILMRERPDMLQIWNTEISLPLHMAAWSGHRDILLYFHSASCLEDYVGQDGVQHLCSIVTNGFLDIALDLVSRYPHVGWANTSLRSIKNPLGELASQASFFRSGNHLTFLQNLIYTCIPLKFENSSNGQIGGCTDVENQASNCQVLINGWVYFLRVCKRCHTNFWDVMELLVPQVKKLRREKLVHYQAVKLAKRLCEVIRSLNDEGAYGRYTTGPVTTAAGLGTFEIIEEIVDIFPGSVWCEDDKGLGIPQLAVINRCEKVFNLVYQMSGHRNFIKTKRDEFKNNILHLVGRLAPLHKLNLVSGAALQMQRELQWFQEVTKFSGPILKEMKNSDGETPAMIFTREHKDLVIAGEKWMKDTANSCTIAAALIITVVFAAAITVPGGNSGDTGLPIFSNGRAFWLFAISDAISLFTSTTSLLMFLSILTARYAQEDFLHALPKRLVIGLFTLFLSITSMIIAFGAIVYLVFGQKRGWIIIPVAALSCLPISSFVTLQFPLLKDVYSLTYRRGIFGKQSDRPFH